MDYLIVKWLHVLSSTVLFHPRDLANHECLIFKPAGSDWVFQSTRGLVHVEVTGRLVADDNNTLLWAAKNGRGVAVLPEYVCGTALAAKELIALLPAFPLQDAWFKAYVPRARHGLGRVRVLLQWLTSRLDPASRDVTS